MARRTEQCASESRQSGRGVGHISDKYGPAWIPDSDTRHDTISPALATDRQVCMYVWMDGCNPTARQQDTQAGGLVLDRRWGQGKAGACFFSHSKDGRVKGASVSVHNKTSLGTTGRKGLHKMASGGQFQWERCRSRYLLAQPCA
jgi:hypothetical protein